LHNLAEYSPETVRRYFRDAAAAYIFFIRGKKFRSHPLVSRMRRYVMENYADDISLKTLSQHFDLSASYMGQVFKQETGMLFTDYLCDFRIEKAKALLAEGLHKNYAVAGMVGFRNPNYFANVFKKKTGVYPSAYRNDPERSGDSE
jgi:two-component system response regulator YesN